MPLSDNLISYWRLDEAASTDNALDAHGSNDLIQVNSPGVFSGLLNGARFCDPSATSRFGHASNSDFQTGDIDFTFQTCVRMNDVSASRGFLGKWDGASDCEYLLYYDATFGFLFYVSPNGTAGSAVGVGSAAHPTATAFTWYCIHCWHDSVNNQIGLAVNNETANLASHSTGVFVGSIGFELGKGGVSIADGLMDESALWKNRVLTAGNRAQLYNGGAVMSYAAILADTGGGTGGRRGSKFGRGFN